MADAAERIASLEATVEGQARAHAMLGDIIGQVARRIDGLQQEMRSRLTQVDGRFTQVDGRIDELRRDMNTRFTHVDGRFTQLEGRFTRTDGRIDELRAETTTRFTQLEGRIDGFRQEMSTRFARIDDRMQQQLYWTAGIQVTVLVAVVVVLLSR